MRLLPRCARTDMECETKAVMASEVSNPHASNDSVHRLVMQQNLDYETLSCRLLSVGSYSNTRDTERMTARVL
jgi:hypothetical protein